MTTQADAIAEGNLKARQIRQDKRDEALLLLLGATAAMIAVQAIPHGIGWILGL